jgi:hypothetical protein
MPLLNAIIAFTSNAFWNGQREIFTAPFAIANKLKK